MGRRTRSAQWGGRQMSNKEITYLVGAVLGVFGIATFVGMVLVPAVSAYRRPVERAAATILSLYVLAALIGIGVVIGAVIVVEWPRIF
jgi:hypothetical protein